MFFKKSEKENTYTVYAPTDGICIPLEEVPDPVFAEKMLGEGVAILPANGHIVSPVSGVVSELTDSKHAYGLTTDDGLELLLHIGIDTVNLAGEGFQTPLRKGDRVKAGDLLAEVDLELLKEKGYDLHTPLIVTNMSHIKTLTPIEGDVRQAESAVLTYTV